MPDKAKTSTAAKSQPSSSTETIKQPLTTKYHLLTEAIGWLLYRNTKEHDIGKMVESIVRYGFQDPPRFNLASQNVNGSKGAFTFGNGRIEALYRMWKDGSYDLPTGLQEAEDGEWLVPISFGGETLPESEAYAFSIDHNNLTVMGGNGFMPYDIARLHKEDVYLEMLGELAAEGSRPSSVSADDLDLLLNVPEVEFKEFDENIEDEVQYVTCPDCGKTFPK